MPDAPHVAVAKAVVAQITAAVAANELSQKFTPQRNYGDWDLDLAKLDKLQLQETDKLFVDIVAHMSKQGMSASNRSGKAKFRVPVDIMLRRKLGGDKQNEDTGRIELEVIDGLLYLQHQIHMLFFQQRPTAFDYAVWDGEGGGSEILWAPHGDHLRGWRQFSGLTRINFLVHATV